MRWAESLEPDRSWSEHDGIGGSEKVPLQAQQSQDHIKEDERPAEQTISRARRAKVPHEPGYCERNRDGIQLADLRSEEGYGACSDAGIVVPELPGRPTVESVPDEVGQQAQEADAGRQPGSEQESALGRHKQSQEPSKTEEEHG